MASQFTKAKLIDEYWFWVQPITLGRGRKVFEYFVDRADVKLIETKTFASGLVNLHYKKN